MFLLTSSIDSNVVESQYSHFEIVFWYSAFVVVLVIFIFYLKGKKNRKQGLENISLKIRKEIFKYNLLISKFENGEKIKKNDFSKTIFLLTNIDSKFVELKELTKLGDFDRLLAESKSLSSYLKKEKSKKGKYTVNDFKKICESLESIYDEIEIVKLLVK